MSPEPPVRPEQRHVGPGWRATLAALERLPQGALSRALGRIVDVPVPRPLRAAVLGGAARALGMDLSEAERPVEEYASLGELFVRRLRPGARAFPGDPAALASPVDGIVGTSGRIERGRALQAKGRDYSVAELLDEPDQAGRYEGGWFCTIYLSPRHYHRIHSPCPGRIERARHVPGALMPVNPAAVASVGDLFARNERMICYVDGRPGRVAVVAVGAYNVGRISAAFDDARPPWTTNRRGASAETRTYEPAVPVGEGDEIMAFHLGSTVVLLVEPGRVRPVGLQAGEEVRLGSVIADAVSQAEGS